MGSQLPLVFSSLPESQVFIYPKKRSKSVYFSEFIKEGWNLLCQYPKAMHIFIGTSSQLFLQFWQKAHNT